MKSPGIIVENYFNFNRDSMNLIFNKISSYLLFYFLIIISLAGQASSRNFCNRKTVLLMQNMASLNLWANRPNSNSICQTTLLRSEEAFNLCKTF